ncbi:MAG TPA: tripartite tricarboxylate transporter substrate binding protein [Thermodesulfobacteriota bacterium]
MQRMTKAVLAAVIGAALAVTPLASAQEKYPSKPIVLVTHSSPGAGGDIFLRQLGKHLEPILGQPIVVENVRGGASAKAVSYVATSKPDGYTLYGSTPTMLQTPLLTTTQHSYKDLKPVANVFLDPMVLYVKADSPYKSLKDAVEDARRNPGKKKWGAATPGSVEHMLVHNMAKTAKIKVTPVTFEGGGDLLVAVLGGAVDLGIGEPGELVSQVEGKQVRVLASFTDQPLPGADYPTAKQQGFDIVVVKFRGLLGPKGMPDQAVRTIENAVKKALESPEYKRYIEQVKLIPTFMNSEDYQKFLDDMNRQLTEYLQEIGVKKS